MMMMMMMISINFYGGIGTKCTENKNSNATHQPPTMAQQQDEQDDDRWKRPMDDTRDGDNRRLQRRMETTDGDSRWTRNEGHRHQHQHQVQRRRQPVDDATTNSTIRQWWMTIGVVYDKTNSTDGGLTHGGTQPRDSSGQRGRSGRRGGGRRVDTTNGNNNQGRMKMMGMTETLPPATGTLDRKTSQASPKACLYNKNNQEHKTREA
jgi:hypothetical protein